MCIAVNSEVHHEGHDVGQRGDDAQHNSIKQLEWQHGVNSEDDEEEERHLKGKKREFSILICLITLYLMLHYASFIHFELSDALNGGSYIAGLKVRVNTQTNAERFSGKHSKKGLKVLK